MPSTIYITIAAASKRIKVSCIVEAMVFADPVSSPLMLVGKVFEVISSVRFNPLFGSTPEANEKRISREGGGGRVGRVAVPEGTERQDLPQALARGREEIYKAIGGWP